MKLLGNLLMTACLIAGCLAVATSYRPRTTDDRIVGLTQTAPAGAREKTQAELVELRSRYEAGEITAEAYTRQREALVPLVPPGAGDDAKITEEDLARLRAESEPGVPIARNVKVQEFSVARWPQAWLFGLSALGLFAGAMLVRTSTKHALAAKAASPGSTPLGADAPITPAAALARTREVCETLLREFATLPSDTARLDAVVDRLGELQKNELASFVDARPQLIARIGMGRYAELMDRFAAAERQVNRAWSAAADGVLPEAHRCLANVPPMIREAEERLG